jgi:hypothetical protein
MHGSRALGMGLVLFSVALFVGVPTAGQWVTRDHRWQPRGPWNWAVPRELPQLFREFNGIDFGHAHLAETLLRTQDPEQVERTRFSTSSSARRRCRPTRSKSPRL